LQSDLVPWQLVATAGKLNRGTSGRPVELGAEAVEVDQAMTKANIGKTKSGISGRASGISGRAKSGVTIRSGSRVETIGAEEATTILGAL
jgi:hypothetical protein